MVPELLAGWGIFVTAVRIWSPRGENSTNLTFSSAEAVCTQANGSGWSQLHKRSLLLVAISNTWSIGWKASEAITALSGGVYTSLSPVFKFQTLTSPPRQPEANSSLDDGWNAMHQGVRGWPLRVFMHLNVLQSTIRTVWSPWEDAILVLSGLKQTRKVDLGDPGSSHSFVWLQDITEASSAYDVNKLWSWVPRQFVSRSIKAVKTLAFPVLRMVHEISQSIVTRTTRTIAFPSVSTDRIWNRWTKLASFLSVQQTPLKNSFRKQTGRHNSPPT